MYSGLQYSAIVYEGFLPASPAATGTIAPTSNVRDIDDSRNRLGCGEPSFFLTQRCGTSGVTCVLDAELVSANWDRRLDDVSEAQVVMRFSGDTTYTCCECLADSLPWCHELHVWRDGEEVWVGPVQTIEYEYDKITINAKDSLAWLGVRVPIDDINFVGTGTDLTDIAIFLINNAFAIDPVDMCEVEHIYSQPTGQSFDFFQAKYTQTALETLRDLGDIGLDFTTLGRTIVLVGDSETLTPLVLLNDEHIMGGLKITKDGTIQGNRFYVHFDGDEGVAALGEADNFYCYGPIERIRDGDGISNGVDAAAIADTYVDSSALTPITIEVTPGSKLSPNTPWTMNEMVPGAKVDVAITKFCLNLTQSFRLTNVEVSYTPDEGEAVGITLSPISSATGG